MSVDADERRLQSKWVPIEDQRAVGEERLTLWLEGGRIMLVVESRWLVVRFGRPVWTEPVGTPRREIEMAELLAGALRGL